MIAIPNVGELVPDQYAVYRPLVEEGITFFLSRLEPQRLADIGCEQARMSLGASVADRVVALLRQCPTLHKLGQVLARDRRLSPSLRTRLQGLETYRATTPMRIVSQVISSELGKSERWEVASEAIAEASVAVVVPFTWHDTSEHLRRDGVFKILKPGVEAKLEEEFEIWSALGPYLEDRSRKHGLLELGFRETLASIQRLLRHEVQFEVERKHLGEAARLYDSMEDVHIPRVLPFSSRRITAIERIYGQKVTDAGDLSMSRRQRLGETIIEALLAKPFFTDAAHGIFHFDPHAGNLLLDRKGRLVILDWSLASQLRGQQKRAIVAVLLGALSMDERRIVQALASLSLRHSNATDALDVVSEALREVRWGRFPGVEWLTALLDQLAVGSGVTFPAELTLFRKMLFTVTGVVADVAPAVSVDRVMLHEGLSQFCRELGPRMITSDQHEHFDTHVSNQELLTLWSTLPLTMQRYWINAWLDALEARP